MTIGEKITELRVAANISQEQLAEKINVSRQSVSKWEMGQALPQIDKVLQLCELFGISTDELLHDKISLHPTDPNKPRKNKYFGTDGFTITVKAEAVQVENLKATKASDAFAEVGWEVGTAYGE